MVVDALNAFYRYFIPFNALVSLQAQSNFTHGIFNKTRVIVSRFRYKFFVRAF